MAKVIDVYFDRYFGPLLYVPVNSYGHVGTVSSPKHFFSWTSLNKRLTSTSCTYFRLLLTTLRKTTTIIIIIIIIMIMIIITIVIIINKKK